MIAHRVRIACPGCGQGLSLRVEAIGRRGVCRHCGHRFRARAELTSPIPGPEPAGSDGPPSDEMADGLGLMVAVLEHEFQQTWARFAAEQAVALEQIYGQLAGQSATAPMLPGPSQDTAAGAPPDPFRSAEAFVRPCAGESSAPPEGAESFATRLDLVARQRDEAREECDRLRGEAQVLRSELAECMGEVRRLGRSADDRLIAIVAERDRLRAEREAQGQEAIEARARIVALELALVEAESAREECRARWRADRRRWRRLRRELVVEARRRLGEQSARIEAERLARAEQAELQRATAREAHSLAIKARKLRDLYDESRREHDEALKKAGSLAEQNARLAAWLEEAEAERREADRDHRAEVERLHEALEEALAEVEERSRV